MNARDEYPAASSTRPTLVLEGEHELIETVLGALSSMVRRSRVSGSFKLPDARAAVAFFRDFADGAHHEKEELHLFPAMEQAGLPPHAGPTSVMREEHEIGRGHMRAMGAALDATPPDVAAFQEQASAFVVLLRDHIAKENQVLFPMAEQLLSPAATSDVARAFAAQDPAIRTHFDAVAERLSAAYAE